MRLLPFDYAVRNLGRSPARMIATVGGSALVVLLMLAASSFVQGMRRSLSPSPDNANVLLVGVGSEESIERSQISSAVATQAAAGVPGIRERLGTPYVSPEVHLATVLRAERDSTEELRGILRGVTPAALLVHPQVEVIEGRVPRSGYNEMMAGALAAQKLGVPPARLAIGQTLWFDDVEWTIVGRFQAPGSVMDAELWTPLQDLQTAAQRDTLSCVVVTLEDGELGDVEAWAAMRLDLELSALSESAYYASLQRFYRPVQTMIWATAILIALAGLLGGLNTLYAAFAARTRELGMLQALGFGRLAVLYSLLQESVVASSAGALAAILAGYLLLDGTAISFSMGVFELHVDSFALAVALTSGLAVGIIGAFPPAIQRLRLPIATALKSN